MHIVGRCMDACLVGLVYFFKNTQGVGGFVEDFLLEAAVANGCSGSNQLNALQETLQGKRTFTLLYLPQCVTVYGIIVRTMSLLHKVC